MRGICLVMLLLVCANAKAAGDRSEAWSGRLTGFEW